MMSRYQIAFTAVVATAIGGFVIALADKPGTAGVAATRADKPSTVGLAAAQADKPSTVGVAPSKTEDEPGRNQKLELSPSQKAAIMTAIRRTAINVTTPSRNVVVAVGAQFPSSTKLFGLPEDVTTDMPAVKPYKFTMVNGTLVLVDPASMRVVAMIRQ
jgi:Protein of unknown function (DUF1236)